MIYTVGHSNHAIEHFLALLQRHGITLLADVRSTPYSRFNPQFRRDALAASLNKCGIEYLFLGEELGARSKDRSCYDEGRVSYRRLAASELFRQGIERLLAAAKAYRVAIMCAEKDPLDCHRTILVTRELVRQKSHLLPDVSKGPRPLSIREPVECGMSVEHILATGEIESHDQAMTRLRGKLKIESEDLFGGASLNEQAYELRGRQIAYVDPKFAKRE